MKRKISVILLLTFFIVSVSSPVLAETLVKRSTSVLAGNYVYFSFQTNETDFEIKFSLSVTSGELDVYILPGAGFDIWLSTSNPSYAYFSSVDYHGSDKYFLTLVLPGTYYVILDNTDGMDSASFDVVVSERIVIGTLGILGIIVISVVGLLVLIAAVYVIVSIIRNRGPKTIPPITHTTNNSDKYDRMEFDQVFKYCDSCGQKTDANEDYCPYCGEKM